MLIAPLCLAHSTVSAYREPEEVFSELWLENSMTGEIAQLGNLTVFRFVSSLPQPFVETYLTARYGPARNEKWIIWGHDIYGVDSGRTKEYCQKMSTDLGVTCILPDFFRGPHSWVDPTPVWDGQLSMYLR